MTTTLPHKIAVLCDLRDAHGRVLLLHRNKQPNKDLYSPIGGKLETSTGESPAQCAQREIREEAGIEIPIERLRLRLLISEQAYQGTTHWLMFVYQVIGPVEVGEGEMDEGELTWVPLDKITQLPLPETDARFLWPELQKNDNGLVAMHIDCRSNPIRAFIEQEGVPAS